MYGRLVMFTLGLAGFVIIMTVLAQILTNSLTR
jgi:hypothetical protein